MSEKELDSGCVVLQTHCIAEEVEGKRSCASSDACTVYSHEPDEDNTEEWYDAYCYSCSQSFTKAQLYGSSLSSELGVTGGIVTERKAFVKKPKAKVISKDEIQEVLAHGYLSKGIRGIKDEYNKFFGHTTKLDKQGTPRVRFYPETKDGKLVGYKSRTFPKNFGYENKGQTGSSNDLSGQVKFKDMQFRDIVLCGGEEDKVAFFQQFSEYQKKRKRSNDEEYAPMPVVSPTTGESSCIKQIRNNYDFINRAERIYIGMDNDPVGIKAAMEVAEIFPKEKVFIIYWSYKDPNGAIHNKDGKDYSAQTIRDFYNAKPYYSNGILTSQEADGLIEEELLRPKMPLPSFMHNLQKKMAGGIPLGYIVNWIAETG